MSRQTEWILNKILYGLIPILLSFMGEFRNDNSYESLSFCGNEFCTHPLRHNSNILATASCTHGNPVTLTKCSSALTLNPAGEITAFYVTSYVRSCVPRAVPVDSWCYLAAWSWLSFNQMILRLTAACPPNQLPRPLPAFTAHKGKARSPISSKSHVKHLC